MEPPRPPQLPRVRLPKPPPHPALGCPTPGCSSIAPRRTGAATPTAPPLCTAALGVTRVGAARRPSGPRRPRACRPRYAPHPPPGAVTQTHGHGGCGGSSGRGGGQAATASPRVYRPAHAGAHRRAPLGGVHPPLPRRRRRRCRHHRHRRGHRGHAAPPRPELLPPVAADRSSGGS